MCLNAGTEKWNDRGNGWVNKLPVCQSEGVPTRAWPLFAPLVTHANLPVNIRTYTILNFPQSPFHFQLLLL